MKKTGVWCMALLSLWLAGCRSPRQSEGHVANDWREPVPSGVIVLVIGGVAESGYKYLVHPNTTIRDAIDAAGGLGPFEPIPVVVLMDSDGNGQQRFAGRIDELPSHQLQDWDVVHVNRR